MTRVNLSRREFEEKLIETFPKLYKDMYGDIRKTCMAFGIECGPGWFDLIWELSEKMEPLLVGDDETTCVAQVKEKYGGLRFYMSHYYNKTIGELEYEYEEKSYKICESCGKEGTPSKNGWIKTLCKEHKKE